MNSVINIKNELQSESRWRVVRLILLLTVFVSTSIYANPEEKRRQLVKIVNLQIREISRLNKFNHYKNPMLLLNLAELFLEKARLIKDKETSEYLLVPSRKRSKINNKKFFKHSRSYFARAQRLCVILLKKYPKFKRADVLYILAYNAKEFENYSRAQKFFKYAIEAGGKHQDKRSFLAYADMLFNKKQYSLAIKYYHKGINVNSKWWTKDSYNLSWALFKSGNRKRAISIMKNVLSKSKASRYVDMSNQCFSSLSTMFVNTGQINQAIKLYKNSGKNISKGFYYLAKRLKSKGKLATSLKLFQQASKYVIDSDLAIRISFEKLYLYEEFMRFSEHLKISSKLVDNLNHGLLNGEQHKILIYQIKRMSGILQGRMLKESKQKYSQQKSINKKSAIISRYFDLMLQINKKQNAKILLLKAENLYVAKNFNEAIPLYYKAFIKADMMKKNILARKSLKGLLSSLGMRSVSDKVKNKYLLTSYNLILRFSRDRKKRRTIYQRLFNYYYKKDNAKLAESILYKFIAEFKNERLLIEAMSLSLFDMYRVKINKVKVKKWAKFIMKNRRIYSAKVRAKVRDILITMQFENVEHSRKKGDLKNALMGYLRIYKDPTSSSEAKKNSAYNISVLFYKLGNPMLTYKWLDRAYQFFSFKDLYKYSDSIFLMTSMLSNSSLVQQSLSLHLNFIRKICKQRINNKNNFYKNGFLLSVGMNKLHVAEKILSQAKVCNISIQAQSSMHLKLIDNLWNHKLYKKVLHQIKLNYKRYTQNQIQYLFYTLQVNNKFKISSRKYFYKSSRLVKVIYREVKRTKKILPVQIADLFFANKINYVQKYANRIRKIKLSFPSSKFNIALKKMIVKIGKLNEMVSKVSSLGSADLYVSSNKILIESYLLLIDKIDKFVPNKKYKISKKYMTSFKKAMQQIIKPFKIEIKRIFTRVSRQIKRNNFLTPFNYYFSHLPNGYELNFEKTLIMDRVGQNE